MAELAATPAAANAALSAPKAMIACGTTIAIPLTARPAVTIEVAKFEASSLFPMVVRKPVKDFVTAASAGANFEPIPS